MYIVSNELLTGGFVSLNKQRETETNLEKGFKLLSNNLADEILVNNSEVSIVKDSSKLYLQFGNEKFQFTETALIKLFHWKNLPYYNIAQFKGETQIAILKDVLQLLPKSFKILVHNGKLLSLYSTNFKRVTNKYLLEKVLNTNFDKGNLWVSDFYCSIKFDEKHAFNFLGDDPFRSSINVLNSETGFSKLSIRPFLLRVFCTNGCTTQVYKGSISLNHYEMVENIEPLINEALDELRDIRTEQIELMLSNIVDAKLIKRINDHLITYYGFKNAMMIQTKMKLKAYEGKRLFDLWDMLTTESKQMEEFHRMKLEEFAGNMLIQEAKNNNYFYWD